MWYIYELLSLSGVCSYVQGQDQVAKPLVPALTEPVVILFSLGKLEKNHLRNYLANAQNRKHELRCKTKFKTRSSCSIMREFTF